MHNHGGGGGDPLVWTPIPPPPFPIGAAKGKRIDTEVLCQPHPPFQFLGLFTDSYGISDSDSESNSSGSCSCSHKGNAHHGTHGSE